MPLHVALYTDATVRGGAEIATGYLIHALGPALTVTVVGTDPDIVRWLAGQRPGAHACVVPPITGKLDVRGMLATRRAIARLRPAVVHAVLPAMRSARWALLAASTVRGVAVVAVEHGPFAPTARSVRAFKRRLERRLAAHVAVSASVARVVEAFVGRSVGSVRVIHNGVPDDDLPPVPHAAVRSIVAVARLDHLKGIDVLLHALVDIDDVRVALVGSGPDEASLQELADGLGVAAKVDWLGWSDQPRALLPGFDLLVLPSRAEGLPLSICEAMLARLPVVASAVGGIPELVVDGETGVLVPPDDPESLSRALNALLDDEGRRARMGEAARERALRLFTAPVMARAYEALYAEIATPGVNRRPRRSRPA